MEPDRASPRDEGPDAAELLELCDPLLVLDADGCVARVNRAEELRSGRPRAEALGRPLAEVRPELVEAGSLAAGELRRCEAHRVPVRFEQHDAGRGTWTEVAAWPVDGGGVALLSRDLTPARQAEEELRSTEARFRVLASAMPQIVCVLRPDGAPEYVNSGWTAFSGLDLAGTARAGWLGVVHPDDVPAVVACRRRALKALAPQDVEIRYRAADGSFRWFLSRLAPLVEGGRVVRFVGSATDIEDRRRAQEALEAANRRLLEADRRKDEFLGMLSHELRNPLAPIRNAIYILDHTAEAEGSQCRRAREIANRQLAHLTRLVDDLLDVTRIARGKIELRRGEVDLAALARRTAEDHRALMHDRRLELAVDAPAPVVVTGDETRLAQVLGNLLHNAAKFTPAGGRVALSVSAEAGSAVVHVRDTGAGIAAEVLPTVFEAFTQGSQTLARSEGGLGLGLALVKGLVALHGGEVVASSPGPGRGSDFAVALPLARRRAAAGAREPEARPPGRPRRVLVIDDNRDAADSLAELVGLLGHATDVAYDGPAALGKAAAGWPDVVLCDLGLPGMDGYELARRLRGLSSGRGLRLVAVSGYAQPEDVARAVEAGFDAHVAKPPDPARLAGLIG